VQDEALEFAACLPASDGIVLHVSGCEKGCAHARTAPFALVARKAGYDLVVNGEASDPPSRKGLSVAEVASLLTREFRVHQR
jgi:precorrin-3B synthase